MSQVVSIRRVRIGARDGTFTPRRTVFCPRANQSVHLEQCEPCPLRSGGDVALDHVSITCTTDPTEAPRAVGSLVLGPLTCIDAAMPFAALRTMRLDQVLTAVVEGDHARYVGCIRPSVFGVALELPPRVRAALLDSARVGDVMLATVPIAEGVTLLEAAGVMNRARARHLPVIATDGSVAGLLDDVTLLIGVSQSR